MGDVAQLSSALTGRYTIEREVGRGGMATVYLARDVRHDRKVALKVLNPELGAVLGVERFLAEIKVTANLQHPNLLPLFDSGEAQGLLFYVMPYVEGESLRARLVREKQLPIDEAVRLACAVAGALDHAHRHGVIHRDLKPENILLHEGQPLIADFGIALAVSNAGGARITQTGLSLGTPQYMSPEQATGDRVVDGRTDIYSLGCVLYEMLTAEPPHTGSTVQAVIARVLTEPARSVRATRPNVPEHVELALKKALEKLPADRWSTATEFAQALAGTAGAGAPTRAGPVAGEASRGPARRAQVPAPAWAGALLLAAIAAAAGWARRTPPPAGLPTVRFTLVPSKDHRFADFVGLDIAISPDGQTVVYMGATGGSSRQFYVRRLNDLVARPLPGTQTGQDPVISPDGKWLAFSADGKVKKVPLEGGSPAVIAEEDIPNGLAWGADGSVYYTSVDRTGAGASGGALWRAPPGGGTPKQLTYVDSASTERGQWNPYVDDATNLLFYTSAGNAGLNDLRLAVISLATGKITQLGLRGSQVLGLVDGLLLFARDDGSVMAAPFDVKTLRAQGDGVPVLDGVQMLRGIAMASLSKSGTLVYQRGASASVPVLVEGRGPARTVFDEQRRFAHPRLSPDGSRIAFDVTSNQGTDIWIYELRSRTFTRLTTRGSNDRPEWTPDGKRVVFLSDRDGPKFSIWWQAADGSGAAEKVFARPTSSGIREVVPAPDGHTLVFREDDPAHRRDIYIVPVDSPRVAKPFLTSEFDELMPRVSPDGKWLLYQSDESGQYEIYVRPFPGGGARVQVSAGGGTEPLWAPDGRRVFYRQDLVIVSAAFTPTPSPAITARDTVLEGKYDRHPFHPNYDVLQDGKTLVLLKPGDDETQMIVVTNWLAELRARLKGAR